MAPFWKKQKIPKTVWLLSFVSLLNDTASEMLYPVMPIFLTQVLGALNTVTSFFTVLSSVIGGILWSAISPSATFLFGMICAVLSLFIFARVSVKGENV